MTLYTVDTLEMTCTCPFGRFKGEKQLCRHVKPILFRGAFYTDENGNSRYRVWKEEGKERWYAASKYKGFVSDSLPTVLGAIKDAK